MFKTCKTNVIRWVVTAIFLAIGGMMTNPAHALLRVDITQGNVDPLPIAIPGLKAALPALTPEGPVDSIGANIAQVIRANLERSGLFRVVDERAYFQEKMIRGRPAFGNWRAIGAQAMTSGLVELQEDGRIKVEFRLWDVLSENQMTGLRYFATPKNWRRVAHLISDAIYKRLTGESGYFDTRIVYISENGPHTQRIKRLSIMDQDGHNHKFLTDGSYLVLTPRFSPTTQEITYLAYYNDKPRVYLFNIDSGKQEVLGDFPGMTFAPRFSPDGNKVIMSMAEKGNSDIYVMELRTRKIQRLTRHPSIDTSPSYAPDMKRVVFNSDRGGSQQLYVMNSNGKNIKRISFGKGRYGTPVWSPRGDLIAFTKMHKGRFYIGVMKPDGSGERLLTESYLDEGPTWAPNGRVLMFFRQQPYDSMGRGGDTQLWSVDLTGYNERQIITPIEASDPAWSPLIR
ncbi:MAG: Tol-Pal system beta propeller repeat protein TolB [Kordiimonas sp.]|nr:Tol-Pal system beta propeller repeat protein TolB [Kordiimonas sp.]